ncbi:hypothetical protein [Exilibacterium tricleocarpae]|uniref:hypothetical protein n=1 Tax=Exilibacterium tricleocarpae TaxID=2591008 RepID=UPI0015D14A47|nr:hypothetical protein [Exilibacterium tricleocarpae]
MSENEKFENKQPETEKLENEKTENEPCSREIPADAAFDRWLGDQLERGETYLDDNGFTDTVMARLPGARLGDKAAALILTLTLLITSAAVLWQLPVLGILIDIGISLSLLSDTFTIGGTLAFILLSSGLGIWALKRDSA